LVGSDAAPATNHVTIDVDWLKQTITVLVNGQQYLSYATSLPAQTYVSFSAGTGTGIEAHSVQNVAITCTGTCLGPRVTLTAQHAGESHF
jgi:hypothetical protein